MTKEELTNYLILTKKFDSDCKRVYSVELEHRKEPSMTGEELTNYLILTEKFGSDCKRVCDELSRINSNLHNVYTFCIDEDDVRCGGSYCCRGKRKNVQEFFPSELLTLSYHELKLYVDNLIEKKEIGKRKGGHRRKTKNASVIYIG